MKNFTFILTGLILLTETYAQDIIYRNSGTEIISIVIEITPDAIKYKNINQPDGPIRNILIKDVFMIIYKDGTKEVFKRKSEDAKLLSENQNSQNIVSTGQNNQLPDNQNQITEINLPKISTNPLTGESTLQDPRDGNIYRIITIGSQVWMAENLKATQYNDGTPIPLVTESDEWKKLTAPGYCYIFGNLETFGAFYNSYAVETGKLCPVNWHVPTDEDWQKLFENFGGKGVAGRKMKEEKGFNALLSGMRYRGDFQTMDYEATWWSATDDHFQFIVKPYKGVFDKLLGATTSDGRSVRCVKD
jgi:uncharacterized protein (TIGR02145 family)